MVRPVLTFGDIERMVEAGDVRLARNELTALLYLSPPARSTTIMAGNHLTKLFDVVDRNTNDSAWPNMLRGSVSAITKASTSDGGRSDAFGFDPLESSDADVATGLQWLASAFWYARDMPSQFEQGRDASAIHQVLSHARPNGWLSHPWQPRELLVAAARFMDAAIAENVNGRITLAERQSAARVEERFLRVVIATRDGVEARDLGGRGGKHAARPGWPGVGRFLDANAEEPVIGEHLLALTVRTFRLEPYDYEAYDNAWALLQRLGQRELGPYFREAELSVEHVKRFLDAIDNDAMFRGRGRNAARTICTAAQNRWFRLDPEAASLSAMRTRPGLVAVTAPQTMTVGDLQDRSRELNAREQGVVADFRGALARRAAGSDVDQLPLLPPVVQAAFWSYANTHHTYEALEMMSTYVRALARTTADDVFAFQPLVDGRTDRATGLQLFASRNWYTTREGGNARLAGREALAIGFVLETTRPNDWLTHPWTHDELRSAVEAFVTELRDGENTLTTAAAFIEGTSMLWSGATRAIRASAGEAELQPVWRSEAAPFVTTVGDERTAFDAFIDLVHAQRTGSLTRSSAQDYRNAYASACAQTFGETWPSQRMTSDGLDALAQTFRGPDFRAAVAHGMRVVRDEMAILEGATLVG